MRLKDSAVPLVSAQQAATLYLQQSAVAFRQSVHRKPPVVHGIFLHGDPVDAFHRFR